MGVKGKSVLIVGAGISGLTVATVLKEAGARVKVLEKGRGFGGRMATRRMAGGRLDHGAQFMTVRTEDWSRWVESWKEAGIIREWFRSAPWDSTSSEFSRYCGVEGMTDIPKALAADLDVERSVRVESVSWKSGGWTVKSEGGRIFSADILILTPPIPQTVALLRGAEISLPLMEWERLCAMDYDPCLTGLLILEGPSGLPEPGGLKLTEGPLAWIGDNQRKGISLEVPAVTVHSTPEFARRYWDAEDDERLPLLIGAAEKLLQAKVASGAVHRWRYNVPKEYFGSPYYWSDAFALGMAGDGFGGGRIEAAALSGFSLGRKLAE
ncbi:MAG: NAD(P)/FAD-dependent oxidoreductase [Puniceicoccales bacterium]